MEPEDVLKLIAEKSEELLKELYTASTGWVQGRIEEIRDLASGALNET